MNFPNRAGMPIEDNDKVLRTELELAGIHVEYFKNLFDNDEVKTGVMGTLYRWNFQRQWTYWAATGNHAGLPPEVADRLYATHGVTVRVDGYGTGEDPRQRLRGLAPAYYHVDTLEGLKALADAIKGVTEATAPAAVEPVPAAKPSALEAALDRLATICEDSLDDCDVEEASSYRHVLREIEAIRSEATP